MSVILHLSDTHFGTEQAPVVEALVRRVREAAPDLLLLSGDITQRARRHQFRAARRFVERLGLPVLAVPGNHDLPLHNPLARLSWPYANYRRYFGEELEPVFSSDELLILSVNSTRAYRHVDGELSSAQIERVCKGLQAAPPAAWRVVMGHHPLHVTREQDEKDLVNGHARALQRWAEAGADLILGGHIHLPFVAPLHKPPTCLPRPLWLVQAGTAVSSRVRHEVGNSFNLLRLATAPREGSIERWDYDPAEGEFRPVCTTVLES